jgi:hypothetical protein
VIGNIRQSPVSDRLARAGRLDPGLRKCGHGTVAAEPNTPFDAGLGGEALLNLL